MPSYRSNVTHKREALNSIIGPSSHDNFPKSPDMLRLRRRCAQTARISLQILSMSKSADTKQTAHPNFGRICRRVSRFRYERFISLPVSVRLHRCVCSSSVRRYLGLVAETRKRKNDICFHFSVALNVYRGFSRLAPEVLAVFVRLKSGNPAKTPNLPL